MSAFAGKLRVSSVGVNVPEGAQNVELLVEVYIPLQVAADKVVPLSLAQLSFDIDKASAIKFADDIKENAEKVSDAPKLDIATDLSAVEQAAKDLDNATKGIIPG